MALPKSQAEKITKAMGATRRDMDSRAKTVSQQLEEERKAKADLEARLQQLEDEKLTASEKEKAAIERAQKKAMDEAAAAREEASTNRRLYESHKMDTDIRDALSGFELFNPKQVAVMLRAWGSLVMERDESGIDRTFVVVRSESGEEERLSPREAAGRFLALDENQNLLKSSVKTGAGSTAGGKIGVGGVRLYTREELANPKTAQEYMARSKRGEAVGIAS